VDRADPAGPPDRARVQSAMPRLALRRFGRALAAPTPMPAPLSPLTRVGIAILATAAAAALTFSVWGLFEANPFPLFFLAVLTAAWAGGLLGGLTATIASAVVLLYFVLSPPYSFEIAAWRDVARLAVFLGVALGMTALAVAQRQARIGLRHQWALCRVTLDSIGDAVIVADAEGQVRFLNGAAAALTGWPPMDAVDRPLSDVFRIVDDATRRPIESPVDRAVRHGAVVGLANHTLLLARDGTERPIDDSAAPIRDPAGAVIGAVLVFRDVTDRRRAESERARLLAAERAARADAETASRAKDEFLATLSHELRTPLTAIVGWVRLLRTVALDPPTTARALETIERNAKLQAQLVDDLLDISRIITGQLHLDVRPVNLVSVVQEVAESLRPAIDAKGLGLSTSLDPEAAIAWGDTARLQQAVWNLVSNAVKFTPEGGEVTVSLTRDPAGVTLQVRDTGIGIAREFLPHVFERFSQADPTRTRQHGGLGLGLAIVRHLVELHGGTVRADSPGVGGGATFTIVLPAPELQASGPSTAVAASGLIQPAMLRDVRLLVVEDEVDARDLLTTALGQCGAAVTAVGSAAEALDVLETVQPDVLVSDIAMPGVDGHQFLRELRGRPPERGGSVPAVALTAHAGPEDRRRAMDAGFQAHLRKPVDPAELAEVIRRLTGRPPAAAGAALLGTPAALPTEPTPG
jgi:PAS domain S-box-containing protein